MSEHCEIFSISLKRSGMEMISSANMVEGLIPKNKERAEKIRTAMLELSEMIVGSLTTKEAMAPYFKDFYPVFRVDYVMDKEKQTTGSFRRGFKEFYDEEMANKKYKEILDLIQEEINERVKEKENSDEKI